MMDTNSSITVNKAITNFITSVSLARSKHTTRTYQTAMNFYKQVLRNIGIKSEDFPISGLSEDTILAVIKALQNHSPATESLYITAIHVFFEFLVAEKLADINLSRIKMLIRQRSRRPGQRLPQFQREVIDIMIGKASSPDEALPNDPVERLRFLRDRSFILTLADTGLRVHEACNLLRGDIDWNEGKALIIGKGNRQAIIRFSKRSIKAIRAYLTARADMDSKSGKLLSSLPVFARHDKGAGKKIKPITPTTGRNIIAAWLKEIKTEDDSGLVTPHSFRHYFVTKILKSSHNLKLAQELARHKNIAVTQRYAHLSDDELDMGYLSAIEQ